VSGPEIAVVVPTHQRRDLVLRLLASLSEQRLHPARFEVAVVCDGCTDGTGAAALGYYGPTLARGLNLVVEEQRRSGAATARNAGVRRTTAPLVLFLDDDMIADPDLLARHLRAHRSSPGAIVLGAVPVHEDSPRSYLSVGLASWAQRRDTRLRGEAWVPPDDVLSGHVSVSRKVFELLGGFDVEFTAGGTFGGEDIDFGWRARLHGIPLRYLPQAVARQVYAKSFRSLARNIREGAIADVRLARRHPDLQRWLMLGRLEEMGPLQRRIFERTLAGSRVCRVAGRAGVGLLETAHRWHRTGRVFERLHALMRAHLYGLGLLDAGGIPAAAASGERANSLTA
jgi:GT2 family glycosyltransferase